MQQQHQQQYSPQGMQMQPMQMQQQHQQVAPMSPVIMTGVALGYPAVRDGRPLSVTETLEPFKHGVVYRAQLSDDAKYLACTMGRCANPVICMGTMTCAPLCDCLYWDSKLKNRSYVEVQENRVETNYAFTCCFGQTVCDDISVIHFDSKLMDGVKAESCCTPFHFCYCIECCGGVVATAPMSCCNNCFCPCFRTFYPGLSNAQGFSSAIHTARAQFREGKRLAAGSLSGPIAVQMS